MGINIRAKGAGGEREVIDLLEPTVQRLLRELGAPVPDKPVLQRNQNQSAVGGSDITNPYGIAFEVKRQEQLGINTWWAQCLAAAATNNECPVLLFRQNGKKWRCVMFAYLHLPGGQQQAARVEVDFDTFHAWFEHWVRGKLEGKI